VTGVFNLTGMSSLNVSCASRPGRSSVARTPGRPCHDRGELTVPEFNTHSVQGSELGVAGSANLSQAIVRAAAMAFFAGSGTVGMVVLIEWLLARRRELHSALTTGSRLRPSRRAGARHRPDRFHCKRLSQAEYGATLLAESSGISA